MSLLELLVVMLIITALASLVLSAVFAVRESQMKSFTETLVQKLASALDQHGKAVIDQIREEPVPVWALTMANGDPRIAKVIYLKTRLKQEFPVTFFEAIYPNANYTPLQTAAYQTPGGAADLPAKSSYARAIGSLQGSYLPVINGSTKIPVPDQNLPPGFEASALLYLTLSQGRRGVTGFNVDENIEPTAIRTATIATANGALTLKYFVDSWGNPVRFWTFPYYNSELNAPPYRQDYAMVNGTAVATTQNQQSPDPQDPERAFQSFANPPYPWAASFQAMVYPFVQVSQNPPTNDVRMLISVVGSAGRDGQWGGDDPSFYFTMTDPTTAPATTYVNDNIYSYRLRRVGRRGD
jgi:type II secretory pathway pseudopilin PulG